METPKCTKCKKPLGEDDEVVVLYSGTVVAGLNGLVVECDHKSERIYCDACAPAE